jgi:hypothetical protein
VTISSSSLRRIERERAGGPAPMRPKNTASALSVGPISASS